MQPYILQERRIGDSVILRTALHALEELLQLLHAEQRVDVLSGMHRILNDYILRRRLGTDGDIDDIPSVSRCSELDDLTEIRIPLLQEEHIPHDHIVRVQNTVRRHNISLRHRTPVRIGPGPELFLELAGPGLNDRGGRRRHRNAFRRCRCRGRGRRRSRSSGQTGLPGI